MIRRLAWEILRSGSTAPTREVAGVAAEAGLDARDRGLLQHLVATEVRRRGSLHALVKRFAKGRPNRDLAAHLRLGLAQLFFLDKIPPHAAVSETVRAATETLGQSKGHYVNAVLRAALREHQETPSGDPRRDLVGRGTSFTEPVFADPEQHPYLWAEDALSMPAPLIKRWAKRFGREGAFELAHQCLDDPRLSIRVVSGEREAIAEELGRDGIETEAGLHSAILTASPRALSTLINSACFSEGRVTVQGEAALRAAEFGGAAQGERWLDLCASPGGKSAVIAASGAHLVACDVSGEKVTRLEETLQRLGLGAVVETIQLDKDKAPEGSAFDGVLVDVPCTNTAVLGRRPEARWRWGPKTRASLAEVQEMLLDRGAGLVRPGGKLVYSTCSLEPDENGRRMRSFIESHAGWALEAEEETFPQPLASTGPVDGGYVARLRLEGAG
jgi:16S rRNA (cytosine967-C5)-methyltransferase